jgi:hypothetical protein
MIQYIYVLKCPNCEDEFFDFFDDAKICALKCLSDRPIITQTEVNRNDFGECTDHCDLGTVWSWEEAMKDTECEAEPAKSIFTKDDFADFEGAYNPENDPEFYELDNSIDNEIDEISDELNEFVDTSGNQVSIKSGRATTSQQSAPVAQVSSTSSATTLSDLANKLAMIDTDTSKTINISTDDLGYDVSTVTIKAPFSREKMSYGSGFKFKDIFSQTFAAAKEIFNKTGVNLRIDPHNNSATTFFPDRVQKIWSYVDNNDILLVNYPGFHFIIDKNDLISQLSNQSQVNTTTSATSGKPIPEGMTIEELVEAMEENEDTVECTKCGGLFEKATCTHNKEGFGWCCSNCEPADTLVEEPQEEEYNSEYPTEDSECAPVSFLEELEEPDVYRERLGLCPECGVEQAFDKDTGFCIECGFNI